jgi:hypothetical protein
MTGRFVALLAAVVFTAALLPALASGEPGSGTTGVEAEARQVVRNLFVSLNARRYADTCALLGDGYYRQNAGTTPQTCEIGLRVGLMWTQRIRFRITAVVVHGDRVVVSARADGAPGRVVLAREEGRLKVQAIAGR